MSFTITLYNYTGEPFRLNKTPLLGSSLTLTGSAREAIDRMSAEVLVEIAGAATTYNYAYIQEFGRYYYIESDTIERTNMHRLQLKTDVLMSHKTGIGNSTGIVNRNEHIYNTNLIDDQLRFLGYKSINTYKFNGSLKNGECIVLAVNGG